MTNYPTGNTDTDTQSLLPPDSFAEDSHTQPHNEASYSDVLQSNPISVHQQKTEAAPNLAPSAPRQSTVPDSRTNHNHFTTVLITDLIMRHIPKDALGVNHTLHVIHKCNTNRLTENSVRETLRKLQTDFICVHLGINDVFNGKPAKEIVSFFCEFNLFLDEYIPNAKAIFSFPLLTWDRDDCRIVRELWELMYNWKTSCDSRVGLENRQLIYNYNSNLHTDVTSSSNDSHRTQDVSMFSRHGIHLSSKGRTTILANFRHAIHDITCRILNKRNTNSTPL